jgi:hypothetical protein
LFGRDGASVTSLECADLMGPALCAGPSLHPHPGRLRSAGAGPRVEATQELDSIAASIEAPSVPSTAAPTDPNAQALDLLVTKSMLYAAAQRHGVNPYLVMGLAWWESGWNESAVSSAGAIGIMQVMPATADADGPALLHRQVDLTDATDNIDMGTAIIKANLAVITATSPRRWSRTTPGVRRSPTGATSTRTSADIYGASIAWPLRSGTVKARSNGCLSTQLTFE